MILTRTPNFVHQKSHVYWPGIEPRPLQQGADPSHGMASTCLMPWYDDMKPKLKRNKSAITECLGVVLMAHALNVGGPRVKSQSRNWLSWHHLCSTVHKCKCIRIYHVQES